MTTMLRTWLQRAETTKEKKPSSQQPEAIGMDRGQSLSLSQEEKGTGLESIQKVIHAEKNTGCGRSPS